jgi:alkaline phosphatase
VLTTADAEMIINYGTSADVGIEDETHTGTQVRLAPPTVRVRATSSG